MAGRPDFLKVLDTVAEKSGWDEKLPAGKARGIAIHECRHHRRRGRGDAVSPKGEIKVERVVAAVDCGHVVNPRTVAMQIESGVVYGMTAALYDQITIEKGAVVQGNFDTYQMVRLANSPKIETHLALSGGSKWGGIGEPGTPPSPPRSATRSSPPPASGSAGCRSRTRIWLAGPDRPRLACCGVLGQPPRRRRRWASLL